MELEMRDPPTAESTFPFPRYLRLPEWLEGWDPLRRLAEQHDVMAIPIEEYVEDDHLVVRAEIPGVDPERDISVSVDAGVLHIRAERREHREETKADRYRSELRYGAFTRSIRLPSGASADDVDASYADGILTVRLPIDAERAEGARIPIRRD